jgi:hypothetical protein
MLLYKDVPWTPDSRSVIVMKGIVAAGGLLDPASNELWCVPIDRTARAPRMSDIARAAAEDRVELVLAADGAVT